LQRIFLSQAKPLIYNRNGYPGNSGLGARMWPKYALFTAVITR